MALGFCGLRTKILCLSFGASLGLLKLKVRGFRITGPEYLELEDWSLRCFADDCPPLKPLDWLYGPPHDPASGTHCADQVFCPEIFGV